MEGIHCSQTQSKESNHETPVKRGKNKIQVSPKTAESQMSPSKSILDVDYQDLFERFQIFVKVSEDQGQPDCESMEQLERKLQFQKPSIAHKLSYLHQSSTMKKKRVQEKEQKTIERRIALFQVTNIQEQKVEEAQEKIALKQNFVFETPIQKEREVKFDLFWAAIKQSRK